MKRYRYRRRNKKQRKFMVIGVCSLFLVMTAGYAAMQTELSISAKGNVIKKTTPANEVISNLAQTNTNELYIDDHSDIRYYGANPNNYVKFNNELWRIIGVMDGKVKIIKNESIGNKYWASNGSNNWNNSDLKIYLNETYYNSIESTSRNMIQENTYYLGSYSTSSVTASEGYDVERSNNVYSGNPISTTQKIGLMYPSDYGYAAGKDCLLIYLINYGKYCLENNYLYNGISQWLQAPYYNTAYYSMVINNSGNVDYYFVKTVNLSDYAVFPVLYLMDETVIIDGDGSQNNPFILQ